ncbi:uncharacterized protein J7T55_007250 [Diaporthe amygdali]|uniref:uncharacterized protein n=1 Tax=Phomopsis amygdali TaxID=1214568 RepID=UPI0022FE4102|nr:uncharacterized protein J7T55_007250 [Diaporthe amygdali]KAJ0108131.1 uncharacterized protein J7T55_007250 [Diaporthe amygdali]
METLILTRVLRFGTSSRANIQASGLARCIRGYVLIEDVDRFDLPDPYTATLYRENEGHGYIMSAIQQLH